MTNQAHINIKKLDGMFCSKEHKCLNPKNGRLTKHDFRFTEDGFETICKHCRKCADTLKEKRELKKQGKGLGRPRKDAPKPSFWKEFKGYAWDCEMANYWISRAW